MFDKFSSISNQEEEKVEDYQNEEIPEEVPSPKLPEDELIYSQTENIPIKTILPKIPKLDIKTNLDKETMELKDSIFQNMIQSDSLSKMELEYMNQLNQALK